MHAPRRKRQVPPRERPVSRPWRITTTGQVACAAQYSLTEPRSRPTTSPCPRLPTTKRSAPREAVTRARLAVPFGHDSRHLDARALANDFLDHLVQSSLTVGGEVVRGGHGRTKCVGGR